MPRYYFNRYVEEHFSIDAASEEAAWQEYYNGDFEISSSDITDSEIVDVIPLDSDKSKRQDGSATKIPFPDAVMAR